MERLSLITYPDSEAAERAYERWNCVAKPLHSLGLLEDAVAKIAGITGDENISLDKRCVIDFCSDNGVVSEGVTQTDSSVTAVVARAMTEGTSNINSLAKAYNADVITVDVGMNTDISSEKIINRKISYGTENIAQGAAMSMTQAERAIKVGIDMVRECREKGYNILITGEMGIGNTTTSSAISSVLLGIPPEDVTGRGAGLSDDGLRRKIDVIYRAIEINRPDKNNPVELISKLGGYDIAAMTGLFLGGAVYHVPIVMDGFISAVSALLAVKINPAVREYMLCSHVSGEPAAKKILEVLGLKPIINAEMRLGEGTGGVMLLPLLDGAAAVYNSAHRFDELPIERYVEQ